MNQDDHCECSSWSVCKLLVHHNALMLKQVWEPDTTMVGA